MGIVIGLVMERFIVLNGKLIEFIFELLRFVVYVVVNEYLLFVYKDDFLEIEECFGRFVFCYEYS